MNNKIRHKAKLLLIELESLKNCQEGTSTISTFALLQEVLKDAGCLAKQINNHLPGTLEEKTVLVRARCKEINTKWNKVSERSKGILERSKMLIARQNLILD